MKLKTILSICTGILLLSGSSQAGPQVPFKARFHGFAEAPEVTDVQNVVKIVVPLHGVATHLGQFDEQLVHFFNKDTGAFSGYADWTAANGDTFRTVFAGQLYPTSDPNVVSFQVTHTIVAGTGDSATPLALSKASTASSTSSLARIMAATWASSHTTNSQCAAPGFTALGLPHSLKNECISDN